MNLSVTELVMASTGNPILSYNSFLQSWSFSETICRINALGMTYLGTAVNFAAAPKESPTAFRNSVHRHADRPGSAALHDGHQG